MYKYFFKFPKAGMPSSEAVMALRTFPALLTLLADAYRLQVAGKMVGRSAFLLSDIRTLLNRPIYI